MATRIPLSLACAAYDRVRPLEDGRVAVDGVDLTFLPMPVEEIFYRMLRHHEFDAAEMSLSSYVMSLCRPDPPFVAIPIFPSRVFRHSSVYVNDSSGIQQPRDLAGRTVGIPEYQMTASVWIRGMFEQHYRLPVDSVSYRTGGLHEPGRTEKTPLNLPTGVNVRPIGPGETLSALLAAGRVDALYTARMPAPFAAGDPSVRRLFADPRAEEQSYFAETGIFPIMHTVVLRRDVYERNRWLAQSLTKALKAAQTIAYADLYDTTSLRTMLPWLVGEAERTSALMGADFWPYGLELNRHTLETFLAYSHRQGLADRLLAPEDLFAAESTEAFAI